MTINLKFPRYPKTPSTKRIILFAKVKGLSVTVNPTPIPLPFVHVST